MKLKKFGKREFPIVASLTPNDVPDKNLKYFKRRSDFYFSKKSFCFTSKEVIFAPAKRPRGATE